MEIISNLALLILCFILTGWIYRSWRALSELRQAPTLKISNTAFRHGKVSILIPAKNEETNIADCVKPLLAQLRDGDELLVINNCSTDGTEKILRELGAQQIEGNGVSHHFPKMVTDPVLRYLNTPNTPEGWTGKNYALHLGSSHVSGDWLLFTDADTRHAPGSVNAAIAFAEEKGLALLTLLPRCITGSPLEDLLQPCAMSYTGLWFPIRETNDPKSKTHFGNGQYLLLRKDHYQKMGGHDGVKEAFLEDFALMKKTKESGGRGMCGFGMEIYGTRMYDSFDAIWRGWRRIFRYGFDQNPFALLRCALSVFFFSVFPFIVFFYLLKSNAASSVSFALCLLILAIVFATAWKAYAIVKAKKAFAFLHPVAALVLCAILLDAAQMAFFDRPTHWR